MNSLEYDVKQLKDTKEKCAKLSNDIKDLKDDLLGKLQELRGQWNTPAGEKFFKEQNNDWETQVNQYVQISGAIGELLEVAIIEYENLTEQARAINL